MTNKITAIRHWKEITPNHEHKTSVSVARRGSTAHSNPRSHNTILSDWVATGMSKACGREYVAGEQHTSGLELNVGRTALCSMVNRRRENVRGAAKNAR